MSLIGDNIGKVKGWLNRGESRTQKLKRNTIGVTAIKYSAILIELLKVPILLSYLDNEKYGVWLTIVSMVMWTHQFDFGLGAGLRYKLTETMTHGNDERGRQLVSTAYISMSAIMLAVFVVLAIVLRFLNWNQVLNVESISNAELFASVIAVLMLFLVRFVLDLVCVVLRADQRTAVSQLFLPIGTIVSLVCILLLRFVSQNSLFLASIFMVLPHILILFGENIYYYHKDYKQYKPRFSEFRRDTLRDIYSMGMKYFIGQFAGLVVYSSSNIIISQILSPSDVSIYSTANQYFSLPISFVSFVLLSFAPPVTEAYLKGDIGWIRSIMKKFVYLAHFATIVSVLMLFAGGFVINIWTGGKIEAPFVLLAALAVYAVMNVYSTPYVEFLGGAGKLQVRMWVGLFKIVTFIPVAIWLMHMWGLVGLVVAITVINIVPNWVLGYYQYWLLISNKAKGIWNK